METEKDMEQSCKEMALLAASEAIEASWPKLWKARNRVVKEKEGKLEYALALKILIKTEDSSDIEANVGCEASWSEKHSVKLADKKVSMEGDLFAPKVSEADKLADEAWEIIKSTGRASTASIHRRMKLGMTAAAAIMDTLEKRGAIGPPRGVEPREILVPLDATEETPSEPGTEG